MWSERYAGTLVFGTPWVIASSTAGPSKSIVHNSGPAAIQVGTGPSVTLTAGQTVLWHDGQGQVTIAIIGGTDKTAIATVEVQYAAA
jgi:hypothetical protein